MAILGWIVGSIGGLVVVGALILAVLYLADKVMTAIEARGEWRQHRIDNERLVNASWWFSEDVPTMELLRDIGNGMDIERARQRWQERTGRLRPARLTDAGQGAVSE